MKKSLFLLSIVLFFTLVSVAQPPNDGYYLDGVNDYIELIDSDNINTTIVNNRTIEGYFKVDDATNRQVIYKEGGGSRGIVIYVENNYIVVGGYNRSNSDYTPRWDGTYFREPISNGTWYHVALVFDNVSTPVNNPIAASDNTNLKWYLDGTLMDSRAGFEIRGHSGDVNLGRSDSNFRYPNCTSWTTGGSSEYCFDSNSQSNANNYFGGNIWGFRIWDDVRTATEIDTNKDVLITSVGTDGLVAALDGDTISYLNDSNAVTTASASNKTVITWSTTAATTSWTTDSNWVGGVAPDATKLESVIIPSSASNYPVLTAHTVVGELTVSASASITVNAGATLDVYYDITNNGTITIENDGALLARENIPVKGTGNFIVKRDSPNYTDRYFYSYWSTPVDETSSVIATIFPNVGGYDYYWDASSTNAFWNNNHTNMEVGRGYAFRANHFNVETAIFDGTVNNGDITEPVFYTNDPNSGESGYNIIGNPYPSAIDWQQFHADNADEIEGTVYYWRQTDAPVGDNLASDYIEYNNTGSNPLGAANGNIGVAQGFAVQAKSTGSGSVTFKNAHRLVANNTQFFRANSSDVAFTTESTATSNSATDGRLSLRLAGNGLYVTQLLGFIPQGTTNFDDLYDGTFINEGAGIEFYSFLATNKLSIQALPELNNTDVEVPLGYQVLSSGTYTLSIDVEYLSQDFDIILEDRYQGTFTDLRQTAYTFTTSPTEENDRFFLNIQYRNTLSIDDVQIAEDEVQVLISGNTLQTITKRTDMETIVLYDISGKQLLQREYASNIILPQLAKGVYIVQYTTENGAVLTRKILKP
ncbi:putative secreted protein (Por secretion system target) [Kordia periserrulae]|uniref:Putative secreted protein (Por secretion system target) n=1 Tax=Kordia periserrulae TaxID=701523 RepID=A0A2T6BXX9_9FLAO|nr:T9SS type A sorting domain-containing protein [Kordia periserrulae]PTX60925.1 putative secreted protein (Por secretion system target) [Kordia periserrulae]